MPRRHGRFSIPSIPPSPDPTIKQRVRKAIADADATLRAAEKIPPETKEAITEIAEQLRADQDDPPAAGYASTPALAPPSPTKPGSRPQFDLTIQLLRAEFPPDGKVPVGLMYKAAWKRVVARTPEGKKPPSEDIVTEAVKFLGRN
jgi:hypothetical protein